MKNKEKYNEIIKYIETRLDLITALQEASTAKDHNRQQLYLHIVEQRQQEINKWLESEAQND